MKCGVVKVLSSHSKSLSLLVFLVFFIFFFISALSIAYAQTYITKYLGTTAVSGLGGTYWNLTDTTGTANTATSVKNAKNTGKFYFKPGTGSSTSTGDPDSGTPVGFGWGTNYTLVGTIPAGTWTFQVNTTSSSATGTGYMGVVVYKNCSGTSTRLFGVFNNTFNVLSSTSALITVITTNQPSFDVNGCYLKAEYWLNVTTAGTSATGTVTFTVNEASEFVQFPVASKINYYNINVNNSNPRPNDYVNFTANFTVLSVSDVNLSYYIFESNITGSMSNVTLAFPSGVKSYIASYTSTSSVPRVVVWRFLANDTQGNWNATPYQTIYFANRYLLVDWAVGSQINSTCSAGSPCSYYQYNTFNASANVTCFTNPPGLSCGSITGGIMFNDTATSYKWINTTTDATSFYVTGAGAGVLCYQESANVSTSCGGLSTGTYYIPDNEVSAWLYQANLIDGDWSTSGFTSGDYSTFYVNYTKPAGASSSSLWQVKDDEGMINLTIPQDCWDFDSTTLLFRVRAGYLAEGACEWSCYNSTWKVLRQAGNFPIIYEEAMYWNITGVQNPQSIGSLSDGQSYLLNYTVNITDLPTKDYKLIFNFTSSLAPNPAENDTQPAYIRITTIADTQPPTYSLSSTNSTTAGTAVSHNLFWQDNVGLSYAIFSFDNCTGSFQNITGMSLSGTSAWSNFTVVINSTVGCTIRWCVYANDTSGNWNTSCSSPFTYITSSVSSTLQLNATKVWWNDSVLARGYMTRNGQPANGTLNLLINNQAYCSNVQIINGNWNCTFYAPLEIKTYTVTINYTDDLGNPGSNSTTLTVSPFYGKAPTRGFISILEQYVMIQDLNGKIKRVKLSLAVWR